MGKWKEQDIFSVLANIPRHFIFVFKCCNANLLAETSDNFSLGFVFEPADNLMIIADAYKIVKDDVVGNFGITNELVIKNNARSAAKKNEIRSTDATIATLDFLCNLSSLVFNCIFCLVGNSFFSKNSKKSNKDYVKIKEKSLFS